ncbi:hypothetical protein EDC01DRAFT_781430 [Geopyxis carbonaria]|nr:hypothetical protein EDC01DRAFT_781430 [Geopyxis carbonaria]
MPDIYYGMGLHDPVEYSDVNTDSFITEDWNGMGLHDTVGCSDVNTDSFITEDWDGMGNDPMFESRDETSEVDNLRRDLPRLELQLHGSKCEAQEKLSRLEWCIQDPNTSDRTRQRLIATKARIEHEIATLEGNVAEYRAWIEDDDIKQSVNLIDMKAAIEDYDRAVRTLQQYGQAVDAEGQARIWHVLNQSFSKERRSQESRYVFRIHMAFRALQKDVDTAPVEGYVELAVVVFDVINDLLYGWDASIE